MNNMQSMVGFDEAVITTIIEQDVIARAMEEDRDNSEIAWALFRLSHANEYTKEFRESSDWPFKAKRNVVL